MENNHKKRILLICSFFFPDTAIAAVRMSNFAINLKKLGYDVTVLSYGLIHRTIDLNLDEKIKNIKVYRVHDLASSNVSNTNSSVASKISMLFNKVLAKFFPKMNLIKKYYSERLESKFRYNEFKDLFNKLPNKKFDVVLGTYSQIENLYFAKYVSEVCNCPYILDFRDGISQNTAPKFIENKLRKEQDELISNSTASVFCTEPLLNWCIPKHLSNKNKLFVVNNGYEKFNISHINHDELTFCFTGNAFYRTQKFDPIFLALRNLIDKGLINKTKVKFLHAGLAGKKFRHCANKYLLNEIAIDYGYVNSSTIFKIQSSSDIFVNIIDNNDEYSSGGVGGKFYEGLRNELPILTICLGRCVDCYLKLLNDKYGFGYVYEEGYGEKAQNDLENYILDCYNKKMSGKKILDPYPEKFKNDFEYMNLTKKLDSVIEYSIENYKREKDE